MIHFFSNDAHANGWLREHPELRVVAISAGHISGSIWVAVEEKEKEEVHQLVSEGWVSPESNLLNTVIPKRRGRPPKVRDG